MNTSRVFTLLVLISAVLTACGTSETPPVEDASSQASSDVIQPADGVSPPEEFYAEDFDDGQSCFDPANLDTAALAIENGELIVEISSENELLWSTCDEVQLDNFILSLDVYDDTQAEGFHYFGLQLRVGPGEDGSDQWYEAHFGLGEGFTPAFCSGLATDSTFESFTESLFDDSCWVDLPERIQPGQWHHIEIKVDGSVLTYSINDNFVASLNDDRLSEGSFGLLAGTFNGDAARVKFDNIRITAIPE